MIRLRRDPLRLAMIRFLERALFWLPLARRLARARPRRSNSGQTTP